MKYNDRPLHWGVTGTLVEVYFYIPAEEAENAVDCGLKLSRWFDREVMMDGEMKKCMAALLNPKDDMEMYRDEDYKCLKLQLQSRYCFVADRYLYKVGRNIAEVMKLYEKSVIPVESYRFGSYRLPECLVTGTVLPGYIDILNKKLDSPVLFDNSEELYMNNIIESYRENHGGFNDTMLYFFYSRLAEMGRVKKMEDPEQGVAVFLNVEKGRTTVVKIPDMEQYDG